MKAPGRGNEPSQDKTLDALIEALLRIRTHDPPLSDEEIRRVRVEDRP
jgi:hypothetical protein